MLFQHHGGTSTSIDRMYDMQARKQALALLEQGRSLNSVSKQTGISRAAIRSWRVRAEPLAGLVRPCPDEPADAASYAYLLGLYLGDGCISPHPHGGYYLRIACADAWPGLIDLCRAAITAVRPGAGAAVIPKQGCVMISSYDRHWPCLFPQHGPGKKHERIIELATWQRKIIDSHPWAFVRGLIHSDGCRITNWTTRVVSGEKRRYEYPRYFFTNRSADVLELFTDTLDGLGVAWRRPSAKNISVARKASVALMDAHVGPKH